MGLQQTRPAVAHQQRLEDAVSADSGKVIREKQRDRGVVQFTIRDDRIVSIDVTGDAERIRELDIVTLDG